MALTRYAHTLTTSETNTPEVNLQDNSECGGIAPYHTPAILFVHSFHSCYTLHLKLYSWHYYEYVLYNYTATSFVYIHTYIPPTVSPGGGKLSAAAVENRIQTV